MTEKHKFSSKENDLNCGKDLLSEEPCLVLEISQEVLIHWHDLKAKGQADSYAYLITKSQELPFTIRETTTLEKRINDAACLAIRECRGLTGRKKQRRLAKARRIKVCKNDTTKPELQCQTHETVQELELDVKCSKLYSDLMEAKRKQEIVADRLNNCIQEKNVLEKENTLLTTQVSHLVNNACKNCACSLDNTSKKIDQVGQRQRQRKIKELKTKAEQALWFFESYGVSLSTMVCL